MTQPLLTRRPHRTDPGLPFLANLTLAPARIHEFCGPSRRTLAQILARMMPNADGPVFWISPAWQQDRLHGEGLADLIDPGRVTFVTPNRPEDLLWSMEEVLRSGCVPLVLCELPAAPSLTSVRRLHLAAQTAAQEKKQKPLGVLLLPAEGGAQGVESRWHMQPTLQDGQYCWHLERRRARMAPPKAWQVMRNRQGFVLNDAPNSPDQNIAAMAV